MTDDVECPYCGKWQEVCHDDGQGYDEDHLHEQQCSDCDKNFIFTTGIIYVYSSNKADCLNGKDHTLVKRVSIPNYYPDAVFCADCAYQNAGKFVDPFLEDES